MQKLNSKVLKQQLLCYVMLWSLLLHEHWAETILRQNSARLKSVCVFVGGRQRAECVDISWVFVFLSIQAHTLWWYLTQLCGFSSSTPCCSAEVEKQSFSAWSRRRCSSQLSVCLLFLSGRVFWINTKTWKKVANGLFTNVTRHRQIELRNYSVTVDCWDRTNHQWPQIQK